MRYNSLKKFIVFGIMMLFAITGFIPNILRNVSASEDGLIGYWSFNEGSGSIADDSSYYGNHGTIYGATWTNGISGNALSFDGANDYVSIASDLIDLEKATWSAWINPTSLDQPSGQGACIAGSWRFDEGWLFSILGGKLTLETPNNVFYGRDSSNDILVNSWSHVAITADDSYVNIYVNGKLEQSMPQSQAINNFGDNLYIGALRPPGFPWYFNGIIDEVRIYSRALSASEIQAHYNNPQEILTADAGDDITAYVAETVYFDGSDSIVEDGGVLLYEWDFGDGKKGYGETTTHTYSECKTYTAKLNIIDDEGNSDSDEVIITVIGRGFWFGNGHENPPKYPFIEKDCIFYLESDIQMILENDPFWQNIFSLYPLAKPLLIKLTASLISMFHKMGHCFGMSSLVVRYNYYPSELSKNYIYDLRINDVDNTGNTIYYRIDTYQNGLVYSAVKFILLLFDRLNNENEIDEIIDSGFPCTILLKGQNINYNINGFKFQFPAMHAVVAYNYDEDEKIFSVYDPNYPDLDLKIEFSDEDTFQYIFYNKLASPSYKPVTIFNLFIDFLKDNLFIFGECPININVYDSNNNIIGESLSDGERHFVVIPDINNGSYEVKINGKDDGEYNLIMMKFLNDTFVFQNFSDYIEKEQITTYTINVNDTISIVDISNYFPPVPESKTPSFELILIILSIMLFLFWRKRTIK